VITSAVFIMLVIGIFVAGFLRDRFSQEAFNILGSVLGVAAGFFFGQSFAKDSR
jgi:positive regulator of sigma E activity